MVRMELRQRGPQLAIIAGPCALKTRSKYLYGGNCSREWSKVLRAGLQARRPRRIQGLGSRVKMLVRSRAFGLNI